MTAKEEIIAILEEAVGQIKSNIESVGANVTGRTRDSFKTFEQGNIIGIQAAKHWATLETGRKEGKVPAGFKGIIREWMDNKGLFQSESESRKNSIAYLIARKIANEGSKLHRTGGRTNVFSNVINDALVAEIMKKSSAVLLKEINDNIKSIIR
jgi:hypothetical protein